MKIGPVDPEIALLNLKKKEINASKIYSPVGRFAERAKLNAVLIFNKRNMLNIQLNLLYTVLKYLFKEMYLLGLRTCMSE